MIARLYRFINRGIWRLPAGDRRGRRTGIAAARVLLLAARDFERNQCQLWASALTFYSLLSVVPVLALAFGIAKGFNIDSVLRDLLVRKLSWQSEVMQAIIGFADRLIANTRGDLIAGVGLIVLLWTVISVAGNIEESFNRIWRVERPRGLVRRFTDYVSMVIVGVVLLAAAGSVTVYTVRLFRHLHLEGLSAGILGSAVALIPYLIVWMLFTFIYLFMPNTKVGVRSGILGGFVAGTAFELVQMVYITFQVGVGKFGAIYGSLAALPLFVVWLRVSWMIVLLGAEIAYASENSETYGVSPGYDRISHCSRRLLQLEVMQYLVGRFAEALPPATARTVSRELRVPEAVVVETLRQLEGARLIVRIAEQVRGKPGYQPAADIDRFTIASVVEAVEMKGRKDIPSHATPSLRRLAESLSSFRRSNRESAENLRLKDLPKGGRGER